MIMKRKDVMKLIISTFIVVTLFFGIIAIVLFIHSSTTGLIIGVFSGFVLICMIFYSVYPVVFKDYIEDYWKYKEEKEREKEELNEV